MPRDLPLRIALAGAGMVARHHLAAWAKLPYCRVVAVADVDEAVAAERASEFGVPRHYGSVGAMLDEERPDALDVAVSMEHHREVAVTAARRRVAILLQKPIAPTLVEARALVDAVRGRSRLMIHENWRFRPYYRRAREWLQADHIGNVGSFTMEVTSAGLLPEVPGATPPALRRQPFLAGMRRLLVLELLVHHLDTLRSLVGEITVDAARVSRLGDSTAGEDTAAVLLAGKDGQPGVLFGSLAAYGAGNRPTDRLTISGESGSIRLEGSRLRLTSADRDIEEEWDADAAYQAAFDRSIGHFAEALIGGRPFETGAADNLRSLALVEDVYIAADRRGRRA